MEPQRDRDRTANFIHAPVCFRCFATRRPDDPNADPRDELLAVEEVQKIVDRLYKGVAVPQTLGLMTSTSGELVALCGVCEAPLQVFPGLSLSGEAAAINVIGRDERFRGHSAGRAMLHYAVHDLIPQMWDGRARPYIHAAVQPRNNRSHAIFDAVGFLHLPRVQVETNLGPIGGDQDIRLLAVNGAFSLVNGE